MSESINQLMLSDPVLFLAGLLVCVLLAVAITGLSIIGGVVIAKAVGF